MTNLYHQEIQNALLRTNYQGSVFAACAQVESELARLNVKGFVCCYAGKYEILSKHAIVIGKCVVKPHEQPYTLFLQRA